MKRNPRTGFRRQRRTGFTLLELLLVMAILVVLAGASGMAIFRMQTTALNRAAIVQIETLEDACKAYKLNNGTFPSQLQDLVTLPSGMTRIEWGGPYIEDQVPPDPWNRPYKYTADDMNDRVLITSAGKDGREGTEDDIPGQIGQ